MPIMKEIPELSLWEISHYWHGFSPRQATSNKLPVDVEKTLRVLAGGASKGLYFRCDVDSPYYEVFRERAWAYRSIVSIYQRELRLVYRGVRFRKKFLHSLSMTRIAIAKWCKVTNTPPPEFWFDADDPLLKKSIEELDTVAALSRNGFYKLVPLFSAPTPETPATDQTATSVHPGSLDDIEIPSREKSLKQELSRIAKENALAKHKPLQEIKRTSSVIFMQIRERTRGRQQGNSFPHSVSMTESSSFLHMMRSTQNSPKIKLCER